MKLLFLFFIAAFSLTSINANAEAEIDLEAERRAMNEHYRSADGKDKSVVVGQQMHSATPSFVSYGIGEANVATQTGSDGEINFPGPTGYNMMLNKKASLETPTIKKGVSQMDSRCSNAQLKEDYKKHTGRDLDC